MVTCTGHIGIHGGADVRTDVHDVMAIKPNFLTSMGYRIFLTMVLHARARLWRARSSAFRLGQNKVYTQSFLRTFAPIVSAHPYCARKCTRHVIHERAR